MKRKALFWGTMLCAGTSALPGQVFSFQQPETLAAAGSRPSPRDVYQSQWISGKPYSAKVTLHIVQSAGGSMPLRIDHTETGVVYRDAQGRTRRETVGRNGNVQTREVSIVDPVAGIEYDFAIPSAAGTGNFLFRPLNQDVVAKQTDPAGASPYQLALQSGSKKGPPRETRSVEDLGTKTVNGVTAQGVRITTTIPAGSIGNSADISVSTEHWVSPDLRVLIKSVYSDPRFGTTSYELTDIQQTPPDPALFQMPAGYAPRPSKKGGGGHGGGVPGLPVKQFSGTEGKQP